MNSPLETAAALLDVFPAWRLHPLCGTRHACLSPGKIPVDLRTGQHAQGWQAHGLPMSADIEAWLASPLAERANLGVLTGQASGIVALDVDGQGGEALLAHHAAGDLPPTLEYVTGGGRRLVYAYPSAGVRSIKVSGDGEHDGLEILADGRQMVLPPSQHVSGRPYAWVPGRDPWTFGAPVACPEWVIRLAHPLTPRTGEDWAQLANTPVSHGGRHPTLVELAAHMAARREDPTFILAMLLAWNEARCKPPKPEAEVRQIVTWAAQAQPGIPSEMPQAYQQRIRAKARELSCSLEAARRILEGGRGV